MSDPPAGTVYQGYSPDDRGAYWFGWVWLNGRRVALPERLKPGHDGWVFHHGRIRFGSVTCYMIRRADTDVRLTAEWLEKNGWRTDAGRYYVHPDFLSVISAVGDSWRVYGSGTEYRTVYDLYYLGRHLWRRPANNKDKKL